MTADGETMKDLVSGIPIAMVTTQGPSGWRGRPLAVQRVNDDGTVWFLVDGNADWVSTDVGTVNLAFVDSTTWVAATGPGTIVEDRAVIDDLGDPVTDTWFEEGAQAVALRISVEHADWWEAPGRLRQAFALAAAKVTGKQPDMGERGVAEP